MKGIVGKECERQTLFITYNNCLHTSDSFGFFSIILAYIFSEYLLIFDSTRVLTLRLNLFKHPSLLYGRMSLQSSKQV